MAKRAEFKFVVNKLKKRRGIHAKSKTSLSKSSSSYVKLYNRQGR